MSQHLRSGDQTIKETPSSASSFEHVGEGSMGPVDTLVSHPGQVSSFLARSTTLLPTYFNDNNSWVRQNHGKCFMMLICYQAIVLFQILCQQADTSCTGSNDTPKTHFNPCSFVLAYARVCADHGVFLPTTACSPCTRTHHWGGTWQERLQASHDLVTVPVLQQHSG